MTEPTDKLAIEILRLCIKAIKSKDESKRREFAADIHQVIVIVDDRLCDQFNLSRKARGKHLLTK